MTGDKEPGAKHVEIRKGPLSGELQDIAGDLHYWSQSVEKPLDRHLADEEDLVVPIVLHHKLRG